MTGKGSASKLGWKQPNRYSMMNLVQHDDPSSSSCSKDCVARVLIQDLLWQQTYYMIIYSSKWPSTQPFRAWKVEICVILIQAPVCSCNHANLHPGSWAQDAPPLFPHHIHGPWTLEDIICISPGKKRGKKTTHAFQKVPKSMDNRFSKTQNL